MTNIQEIWKPIQGYEGFYEVSNFGRIKSLPRNAISKCGKIHYIKEMIIMKNTVFADGYIRVNLRKDFKYKLMPVHRAVCGAFIPNPENKPFVNHKNGVQHDNSVNNLEWVTKSENERHAFDFLGKKSYFKNLFGKYHPRAKPVLQINNIGDIIKKWDCPADAERIGGFSAACIRYCARGITKTHKKYSWVYV